MDVLNVHERMLKADASEVGQLVDTLASKDDELWPHRQWPPMKFDRPLQEGAKGGHGPIEYYVEAYEPGHSIQFHFTKPVGFLGNHRYEVEEVEPGQTRLRHLLEMKAVGMGRVKWLIVFRWLHDALIEDSLDKAEVYFGRQPAQRRRSVWIQILRWVIRNLKS